MSEQIYKTTLLFEWEYKVWGKRKRNYELPRYITGRHRMQVEGTLEQIKDEIVQEIKDYCRKEVDDWYDWEDEIDREAVKLYHIREATIWSSLEDF